MVLKISASHPIYFFFFFFNDTATTEIYTLSLHDALPIRSWARARVPAECSSRPRTLLRLRPRSSSCSTIRSEEHTSELQSRVDLVCRLLLEKKKKHKKKKHKHIKKSKL